MSRSVSLLCQRISSLCGLSVTVPTMAFPQFWRLEQQCHRTDVPRQPWIIMLSLSCRLLVLNLNISTAFVFFFLQNVFKSVRWKLKIQLHILKPPTSLAWLARNIHFGVVEFRIQPGPPSKANGWATKGLVRVFLRVPGTDGQGGICLATPLGHTPNRSHFQKSKQILVYS